MGNPVQQDREPEKLETDLLFGQVYERLKAMAGQQLGARANTLDATALVHELYLRIGGGRELAFEHPDQFFTYAARAMRHLLADRARDRLRQRAGGEWVRTTLTGSDWRLALDSADRALELAMAEGAAPVQVLRMGIGHLQRLHRVRLAMDAQRLPAADAVKQLRPPLFFRRVAPFTRALSLWNSRTLAAGIAALAEAERGCKRTGWPDTVLCRQAILSLARRAAVRHLPRHDPSGARARQAAVGRRAPRHLRHRPEQSRTIRRRLRR